MHVLVGRDRTKIKIDKEDYDQISSERYYFCNSDRGYIVLKKYLGLVNGVSKYEEVYLHRYIMKPPKGYQVDHINRDKFDNRKENLRICSSAENAKNRAKNNGTYKGVFQNKSSKKWIAQITKNYKCYHIGSFDTAEQAALAYNEMAKELHGKFAFLNVIVGSSMSQ